MSTLDRRSFLTGVAAAPLIYGLRELSALGEEPDPEWLPAALARMKETGRWGVVLVLPPEKDRFAFGQALWALTGIPTEGVEAHPLFCEAVFSVLTAEQAKKKFGVAPTARRILLSADGKVLESDADDVDYRDPKSFASSFRLFIQGKDNARLTPRAAEIERELPAELREALGKLGSESPEDVLGVKLALGRQVERLVIVLVQRAETSPVELVRKRAANLITSHYASLDEKAPGSKVPYGATGPHYFDPCRSCGMAVVSPRSRMFLKFLVPGQKSPVCENDR
ncbi:MAG TPA: hypothetical protein VKW04_00810 [Planctomycetota bacterium]|nr:hypothetical protein [Planctomycetota bacterium]